MSGGPGTRHIGEQDTQGSLEAQVSGMCKSMVRNPVKVTLAILLRLVGAMRVVVGANLPPWFSAARDTAGAGHPYSHCPFSSVSPSTDTLCCLSSWSLIIFLTQKYRGPRLCPGAFLSSIFTHTHSNASFKLMVLRHKCPSSLELSPDPRSRHLTTCLISTWMSNGHLRLDLPSSRSSQLSRGQPSLLLVREKSGDSLAHLPLSILSLSFIHHEQSITKPY